jgi:hypothetical protein
MKNNVLYVFVLAFLGVVGLVISLLERNLWVEAAVATVALLIVTALATTSRRQEGRDALESTKSQVFNGPTRLGRARRIERTLLRPLLESVRKRKDAYLIGESGTGKSTLLEELRQFAVSRNEKVIYLSGATSLEVDRWKQVLNSDEQCIVILDHLETLIKCPDPELISLINEAFQNPDKPVVCAIREDYYVKLTNTGLIFPPLSEAIHINGLQSDPNELAQAKKWLAEVAGENYPDLPAEIFRRLTWNTKLLPIDLQIFGFAFERKIKRGLKPDEAAAVLYDSENLQREILDYFSAGAPDPYVARRLLLLCALLDYNRSSIRVPDAARMLNQTDEETSVAIDWLEKTGVLIDRTEKKDYEIVHSRMASVLERAIGSEWDPIETRYIRLVVEQHRQGFQMTNRGFQAVRGGKKWLRMASLVSLSVGLLLLALRLVLIDHGWLGDGLPNLLGPDRWARQAAFLIPACGSAVFATYCALLYRNVLSHLDLRGGALFRLHSFAIGVVLPGAICVVGIFYFSWLVYIACVAILVGSMYLYLGFRSGLSGVGRELLRGRGFTTIINAPFLLLFTWGLIALSHRGEGSSDVILMFTAALSLILGGYIIWLMKDHVGVDAGRRIVGLLVR